MLVENSLNIGRSNNLIKSHCQWLIIELFWHSIQPRVSIPNLLWQPLIVSKLTIGRKIWRNRGIQCIFFLSVTISSNFIKICPGIDRPQKTWSRLQLVSCQCTGSLQSFVFGFDSRRWLNCSQPFGVCSSYSSLCWIDRDSWSWEVLLVWWHDDRWIYQCLEVLSELGSQDLWEMCKMERREGLGRARSWLFKVEARNCSFAYVKMAYDSLPTSQVECRYANCGLWS